VLLDEASVTATENAICAAVLAQGQTTLRNAACEPHVQGLCRMLRQMGAKIEGIGSNILSIQGVARLRGGRHRIGPDYLEIGSFISVAAVTGGKLLIKDVCHEDLRMILQIYGRLGVNVMAQGNDLLVPAGQALEITHDLGGAVAKIDDAPWPGFPADLTSIALVTATQCRGTILIHEKMYESRLFFVDNLIAMGAQIILCDPHRAVVIGMNTHGRSRCSQTSSPQSLCRPKSNANKGKSVGTNGSYQCRAAPIPPG
jgi:UDP-N-acetylglucosamine 1-carboxyvinyltransferase